MKHLIFLMLGFFSACAIIDSSKSGSPKDLFAVAADTVSVEEFIYAFNKNRPEDSAILKSEVDEYLALYKNFKLKVAEAKALGMDTTQTFRNEFKTYIGQLDNSYLQSTNDTDSLVQQAYERLQTQVNASHILLMAEASAPPEDTLAAFIKITAIRDSIVNQGADFGTMAVKYSEDPSAVQNRGNLGFFNVFQMVYPFENAAFTTNVGEVSEPVRTRFGYHIVKVNDKRANEGRVRVAHIMIRNAGDAKDRAFGLHEQLIKGADWNELCAANSEDYQSASRGGELAPFSRDQIVKAFSDAAFNLKSPGEISAPVQTPYGWHIIKLIERIPVEDFKAMEEQLATQVKRGDRSKVSEEKMLDRLAAENNFVENSDNVQLVINPESHQYGKTKFVFENDSLNSLVLFSIGDKTYPADSLYAFMNEVSRHENTRQFLFEQYNEYRKAALINYEKAHLAEKYPEYKYLKKEYFDGILLFSIMEDLVWNPASTDSTGLESYYQEHQNDFIDSTSIEMAVFSSSTKASLDSIQQRYPNKASFLKLSRSEKEALMSHNNDSAKVSLHLEFAEFDLTDNLVQTLASLPEEPEIRQVGEQWLYLIPIRKVGEPRRLANIRGRLIADYQEELEAQWLKDLAEKYQIYVDEKALKYVYKKLDTK